MLVVLNVVVHARLMIFARMVRLVEIDGVRLDSVAFNARRRKRFTGQQIPGSGC